VKISKSQLKQIIKEEITDILNEEGTAPTAVGLPNDIGTPEKLLAGLRALDIEKTDHNQATVIVNFINKSLMKNPSEDVANALRDYKQKLADHHGFRDTKSRRDAYRDKAAQAERPKYSSERDYQQNPFFIGEENLDHPTESNPGHQLVIAANDALHEAYLAVEQLANFVDEKGKDQIPGHAGVTLSDVISKIDFINGEAEYLK